MNTLKKSITAPRSPMRQFFHGLGALNPFTARTRKDVDRILREPHFFEREGLLKPADIQRWYTILGHYGFDPDTMKIGEKVIFETVSGTVYTTEITEGGFMISNCIEKNGTERDLNPEKLKDFSATIVKINDDSTMSIVRGGNGGFAHSTTSYLQKIRRPTPSELK